jgi:Kelch motif
MTDQLANLRELMRAAADRAGPFEPPPVIELTRRYRRRSQARGFAVVAASVAAVVAVAAGLSWAGRPSHDIRAERRTSVLDLPRPSGPAVPVRALRTYQWSALPKAPIEQRTYAASAWTGQVMIVWGGQAADDSLYADGATYDPATRTWTTLPPSPLSARSEPLSAVAGGSFYVWGGRTDPSGGRANDGARFDLRTRTWTRLAAAPVSSYAWAQLVVADGRPVLLSSRAADALSIHADRYDAAHDRWRALPDLASPPNHEFFDATALGVGPTILLWRYWSHRTTLSSDSRQVEIQTSSGLDSYAIDPASGSWRTVPLKPDEGFEAREPLWTGRQVVLLGEDIYCGGCSHPARAQSPGVAIDPSSGGRTRVPPVSRGMGELVWTGAAALALNPGTAMGGGGLEPVRPGDLAAWDPATNRWTRLRGAAIHGDAYGAATVWAGKRLLVWGLTPLHGADPASVGTGLEFGPPAG